MKESKHPERWAALYIIVCLVFGGWAWYEEEHPKPHVATPEEVAKFETERKYMVEKNCRRGVVLLQSAGNERAKEYREEKLDEVRECLCTIEVWVLEDKKVPHKVKEKITKTQDELIAEIKELRQYNDDVVQEKSYNKWRNVLWEVIDCYEK